jgi:hypothetical protein
MQTSESIKSIAAALVAFHKEVGKIPKDANNPFFKSRYASLSGILEVISNPLISNGLTLVQFPDGENGLTSRLCHTSGEWMEATYSMKPAKDDPQGRGSALTYQRRYAIGAILSLNIDEDDDGNAASKQQQPAQQTNGQQADDKPWLNEGSKEFEGAIFKLKEGTTTIKKIEAAFKLSKKIRTFLEAASQQPA